MKAALIENRGGLGPSGYKPVIAPQCEADVVALQPTYRKSMPSQCLRKSQYVLDGKHYCGFHAGIVALNHLLSQADGLPPINEELHTPERIAELQRPAMKLD